MMTGKEMRKMMRRTKTGAHWRSPHLGEREERRGEERRGEERRGEERRGERSC